MNLFTMMRSLSSSSGSMLVPWTRNAWATKVMRKKQKRTATERSWTSSHSARQIWERVSSRGGVIVRPASPAMGSTPVGSRFRPSLARSE
jgi:hypothetical protein